MKTIAVATLTKLRKQALDCMNRAAELGESRGVITYFDGKFTAYGELLGLLAEATDAQPPRSDERAYDAPAAGTIRVQIGISDHSEAVLDIHIAEDGLGGIDQPTKREPTAREMDLIASALRGSGYQFNSTLI